MYQDITRKSLTAQLTKLEAEIIADKQDIDFKQKALSAKYKRVKDIKNQIAQLRLPAETTISEHAIVRYLERFKGMDIEQLRKEILTDKVLEQIRVLGENGEYVNDKIHLIVRNNVVVTIK